MTVHRFPVLVEATSRLHDPVDRRLAQLIGRSMRVPGRHGFSAFWREFMQRGYDIARQSREGRR